MTFHPSFRLVRCTAFRLCITLWGQKWTVWPSETIFSQKNGLKTAILGEQILHRLTSEGAGTQIFKGIANFSMCFKKFGTLSSKWAMGKASNFNSVRETNLYFFLVGGTEKLQKTDFFRWTLTPQNLLKKKFLQHRTMSKLTSRRIWKCIIWEGYSDFCASYYLSKSTHGGKNESVPIIMRCPKKIGNLSGLWKPITMV